MFVEINRSSNIPIKKQLYDALTYKILNKELKTEQKMPSSRQLAAQLNIARNTVTEIYDQLVAEAYLKTRQGKGTFVEKIADFKLCSEHEDIEPDTINSPDNNTISLVAGSPDLSSFPNTAWMRAYRNVLETCDNSLFDYGNVNGYYPLRKSLVRYLKYHKGIYCNYQQIIITNGTQNALTLIASAFNLKYKGILIESPSVDFVQNIFSNSGYNIYPAYVDKDGIIVDRLNNIQANSSLIYTSPAHQFPLGGTLPIGKRQKLVDFALENNHIILEDDYDSEFRYKGAPVNSLYQLSSDNVIHLGSFSKTLCPSIRLGYMVVPSQLLADFNKYQESAGTPANTINHAIINDMITTGVYENHVYKMTKLYKSKMKLVIQSLRDAFNGTIKINGSNLGLHISVEFLDTVFEEGDRLEFVNHGLEVELLNDYRLDKKEAKCNTIIIGFGHLSTDNIVDAIKRLTKAITKIKLGR